MSTKPPGQESDRVQFLRATLAQSKEQAAEARAALIKCDFEYQQASSRLYQAWVDADARSNIISQQLDDQSLPQRAADAPMS